MARSVLESHSLNGPEVFGSVVDPVQILVREILEYYSEHIVKLREGSSVGYALPRCTV